MKKPTLTISGGAMKLGSEIVADDGGVWRCVDAGAQGPWKFALVVSGSGNEGPVSGSFQIGWAAPSIQTAKRLGEL